MLEYDDIAELCKAAPKRMEDALELLTKPRLNEGRSDADYRHLCAAQYLAGYAVECILKAYIINRTDAERRTRTRTWSEVLEFRQQQRKKPDLGGSRSHDLELLLRVTDLAGKMDGDKNLRVHWDICCKWRPSLRYRPLPITDRQGTEEMVGACQSVYRWLRSQVRI